MKYQRYTVNSALTGPEAQQQAKAEYRQLFVVPQISQSSMFPPRQALQMVQ